MQQVGRAAGSVALVTGASSGLGWRFAVLLAECGLAVAVAARREEKLNTLVEEISARGGRALAFALDVTDAGAITRVVEEVERRFGIIDVLINNAGVADGNWAVKLPLEVIDEVIDTNFRGPFLLSCAVAERLIAAKRPGRIINLSSMGAFAYAPRSAAALYCAAKGGIARLTETLALEWAGFNINVNAIAPGLFRSEMSGAHLARKGEAAVAHFPRKRVGEPEQLDTTLLYLLAPGSEMVTGITIKVDDAQMQR
jgi:NAD(P)-dependent dehydrogenase (short-subunit alcohol dehydrogenase family)